MNDCNFYFYSPASRSPFLLFEVGTNQVVYFIHNQGWQLHQVRAESPFLPASNNGKTRLC